MQRFAVAVPLGMGPGRSLQIQTPDGSMMEVTIPPGVGPGQDFEVQAPMATAAPAVVMNSPAASSPGAPAPLNEAAMANQKKLQSLGIRFPKVPTHMLQLVLDKHDGHAGLAGDEVERAEKHGRLHLLDEDVKAWREQQQQQQQVAARVKEQEAEETTGTVSGTICEVLPASSIPMCYALWGCWLIDWMSCDGSCCQLAPPQQLERWRSRVPQFGKLGEEGALHRGNLSGLGG